MSDIEEARNLFFSTLESLKTVSTREELEDVRVQLKRAREKLFELDSEFKANTENKLSRRIIEKTIEHNFRVAEIDKRIANTMSKYSINR